jgi:carbamoyl-phosphate synthase small subunit
MKNVFDGELILEDGSRYSGRFFGSKRCVSGEVVFNTGMVGYPEALTDPSYYGQILVLTYPLIGNYGVPKKSKNFWSHCFESDKIQVSGLIVSYLSQHAYHWSSSKLLDRWLREENVPGLTSVDTRALTKRLREKGTMLGKIVTSNDDIHFFDPNKHNLVSKVSIREKRIYGNGSKKVILVDCGLKNNILRSLLERKISVVRVPWDYDFTSEDYDGVIVSNGPGNPEYCAKTIKILKKVIQQEKPVFGICLGNQLLALALGGKTYKMKYGHRSQNQPCIDLYSGRCYITAQNHGYAVDEKSLPENVEIWFQNLNDGTNEGIRHKSLPIFAAQFHPEDCPGPRDMRFIFDEFIKEL